MSQHTSSFAETYISNIHSSDWVDFCLSISLGCLVKISNATMFWLFYVDIVSVTPPKIMNNTVKQEKSC